MQINAKQPTASVLALDAARRKRVFIDLANASPHWQQTKASFTLEGVELTDDDAQRAGRLIAGVVTVAQIVEELRQHYPPDK